MGQNFNLDVSYYRLSEAIQPYFTALYSFTIDCQEPTFVEDFLHPEWAAMRFTAHGAPPEARVIPAPMQDCWPFVVSGPTNRAIHFRLRTSRIYGLGLQPAGWARFIGVPAASLSNAIADGSQSAFAAFAPLLDEARAAGDDDDRAAARMNAHLLDLFERTPPEPARVLQCQEALKNPDMHEVEELAAELGISRRTLERMCTQYFGFPPKTLLRRQRFLRSLGRFMAEAPGNWSKALDRQYFDQAHFVRDFRSFMGMTPSEYAAMPHPILDRIIAQRMVDQGAATQTDLPTVLRYAADPGVAKDAKRN